MTRVYRNFIRIYTGENMEKSFTLHLTTRVMAQNSLYKTIITTTILIENYKTQNIIINETQKSQSLKVIRVA